VTENDANQYWLLESRNEKRMLLMSLAKPAFGNSWLFGKPFTTQPVIPIVVSIIKGYETAQALDYFGTPPVISDRFHQALVDAGVDNIDVYDATLMSEDRQTQFSGYKACNIIGLVKAADLAKTVFSRDNPSRLIDASIDSLAIDANSAKGHLFFRLAEYSGAVVVHDSIKRALEKHQFPHLVFSRPESFMSL
jgi:hypothetical protein